MDLATILGKHNQNWQVLVFLTVLCIVLGFVAKLCRESRCFGVKFYVANHAVLVPHFDPPKKAFVPQNNFFAGLRRRQPYESPAQKEGQIFNSIRFRSVFADRVRGSVDH